ncbi:DUF2306 domain-containing protein [Cytobacillus purgationiresistens]|uniref:Vacuolar-type H+-ATPase subunit I/STV1 n=1 Tax=Cytobacillus purgationiresistens TaxID=863449 RepID=A0ABU0AJB2_9BACI|nr:DUF2306 domain-containing protein [Cytobacillus purgationiresistens]MDQ0270964.1 vacuolar-type H+-ATPase subunit I/STV1 [Cytobacillus purgationiresistens]
MSEILLVTHILFGTICLLTGFFAILFKKRKGKHTISGEIYHFSYFLIFFTSVVMAIINWNESAYLFYIAIFSYSLALIGYLARKFKWKKWLYTHIVGMLGSYIGVITAVLVVNQSKIPILQDLPPLLVWFLPTIIGSPLITKTVAKYITKSKKTLST